MRGEGMNAARQISRRFGRTMRGADKLWSKGLAQGVGRSVPIRGH